MPLEFHVTDKASGNVTILSLETDASALMDRSIGIQLFDGEELLFTCDCPQGLDFDALIHTLSGSSGTRWPDSMQVAYTSGDCDVLSVAFDRVMGGGHIVGVTDPCNEDGDPIDGPPYLIHAGYLVGDVVYDVEGMTDRGAWEERWSGLGSMEASIEWLDREDLERLQSERMTEEAIEKASECVRLIALAEKLCFSAETVPVPA